MDPAAAELKEEYTIDVFKKRIREILTEALDKLQIPQEDMAGVITGVDKLVSDFHDRAKLKKKRKMDVSHYNENYVHVKYLGIGCHGSVSVVKNKINKKPYALKIVPCLNKKCLREAKMLSRINHPHIVRYFHAWIQENNDELWKLVTDSPGFGALMGDFPRTKHLLFIVMELCEFSLDKKLCSDWKFDFEEARNIFTQIVKGVQAIHNHLIVHNDLTVSNIFIDQFNVVKIGDFGVSKTPSTSSKSCTPVSSQDRSSKGKSPSTSRQSCTPASSQEISSQGCDGTGDDLNILDICPPLYAGYEDDNSAGWSTGVKDDIANLGIILFSLLFDSKLVPVEERPKIWRNLKNLQFPSPWRFDDKYSVVREFILSMFKVDRPSPSSILEDIPLKVLLID